MYSADDNWLSVDDDKDAVWGGWPPAGVGRVLAFDTGLTMLSGSAPPPDLYDAHEMARAAGRPLSVIQALIDSGKVSTVGQGCVAHAEAVRVLRALRDGRPLEVVATPRPLFSDAPHLARETGVPVAASTAIHGVLAALGLLLAILGRGEITEALGSQRVDPVRLVFLATPGPGGGGGGGGLRQPAPPEPARRAGRESLTSPVPPPEPTPEPTPRPEPAEEAPPVAPVASVAADAETKTGVIEETAAADSKGAGRDGSAGTGQGGGIGAGQGAGIGEGSGGGTGGGPFRPGSGIEPPSLVFEVKPDYPEDARRRTIEGDVVLEIVVRRDGSVGDVRVLKSLGASLDQRAIEAVRQWRFDPARRRGTPVDVLVEVSVEFKLR